MNKEKNTISNGMKIVTVIPLVKGVFKQDLTYFTAKEISIGNIVSIMVRNRKILALVISIEEVSKSKKDVKDLDFSLRKILEIKNTSIFLKEYLDSTLLLAKYFTAKKNTAIASLIPTIFLQEYDKLERRIKKDNLIEKLKIEHKNIKTEKLLLQTNLEDRISYYKTLIRGSFAQKKSVFIVLPTENDINFFKEKLSKGIENFTIVLSGNLTPKKQIEGFENIATSEHPILVLSTAPFLSIPRYDIETIILEHESSNAYKMISPPHFDLRTFTEIYASKIGAKFILGDSLLRYETIARKDFDNFSEIRPLSFRLNFNGEIDVISRNSEDKHKKFKIFEDKCIEEIKQKIIKNEKIFIFSLRKGLATMTFCKDCNEPVMCKNCSAPVVLYLSRDNKKRMFICNRCGTEANPDAICEYCGSWNLIPLGIGTDTVYEEIKKLFPKTEVFQLDKENAKTAKGAEKIINDFNTATGGILIGTEMAVLYLKEKLPLSIIVSFDSLWTIPNFRMGEKIIQLLTSIISKTEKKIIIQTRNEKDATIKAFQNENLLSFIREELIDRKNLEYPPYKRFIKISHLGNKEETIKVKQTLTLIFEEYNPIIFSGFVAKQKDKYVTNALIKMDPKDWSLPELTSEGKIDEKLTQKLSFLSPDFSVNIDPEDLL